MACYFIVSVQIGDPAARSQYDEYIRQVRPLVESCGGEYLVRSENLELLSGSWRPDRVIVIRFPDRETLDRCFNSPKYKKIAPLRLRSVAASAVITDDASFSC